MIRIAHFSDLHYGPKNLIEADRCFGAAIDRAVAADGDLLADDERAGIDEATTALRSLRDGDDAASIRAAVEALNAATATFAQKRMDRGVQRALADRGYLHFELRAPTQTLVHRLVGLTLGIDAARHLDGTHRLRSDARVEVGDLRQQRREASRVHVRVVFEPRQILCVDQRGTRLVCRREAEGRERLTDARADRVEGRLDAAIDDAAEQTKVELTADHRGRRQHLVHQADHRRLLAHPGLCRVGRIQRLEGRRPALPRDDGSRLTGLVVFSEHREQVARPAT